MRSKMDDIMFMQLTHLVEKNGRHVQKTIYTNKLNNIKQLQNVNSLVRGVDSKPSCRSDSGTFSLRCIDLFGVRFERHLKSGETARKLLILFLMLQSFRLEFLTGGRLLTLILMNRNFSAGGGYKGYQEKSRDGSELRVRLRFIRTSTILSFEIIVCFLN